MRTKIGRGEDESDEDGFDAEGDRPTSPCHRAR